MAHIKIKSIKRQAIMSDKDFEWITKHLGMWLPVMSINWSRNDGSIFSFAIYTRESCISVFPDKDTNDVEYEVSYR